MRKANRQRMADLQTPPSQNQTPNSAPFPVCRQSQTELGQSQEGLTSSLQSIVLAEKKYQSQS